MSRTYRKCACYWRKYRGKIYCTFSMKSIVGKEKNYKKYNWKDDDFDVFHGGRYYVEVKVADVDSYGKGTPSVVKKIFRRVDRARAKNAFIRNPEDVHYRSSFDPWYWD